MNSSTQVRAPARRRLAFHAFLEGSLPSFPQLTLRLLSPAPRTPGDRGRVGRTCDLSRSLVLLGTPSECERGLREE